MFPNGIHRGAEKILFSNLNNFFSRHFKNILNGQKFDNLFIFQLLKFGGDLSKTMIYFFHFLRVLEKWSNDARLGIKLLIIVTSLGIKLLIIVTSIIQITKVTKVIDAQSGIFTLLTN